MQKKYLTTPIYYVNDVPHIGHAYCTLATDTLARYWRQKLGKENVFFLTGTDENSQKTVDAAHKAGEDIHTYLDNMATQWKETWDTIGVSYDDFVRTTEPRHVKMVNMIFERINANGDIYKDKYVGKYCTGCEAFLKDSDLDEKGDCPHHKRRPETIEEENYFFRLSKYEKPLLELLENPDFLRPGARKNEMVSFIKSGLEDVSISRETAEFGIPLPIDETHKVYVWFDALINYQSAIQIPARREFWGSVMHIIGKDITRFHAVIWPAMLLSAGMTPPKSIFAHGFFTIDGVKMSKTLGNVVSPLDLSQKYGNDALRVGLLSSFEFGHDGDFSLGHFHSFYDAHIVGGVGNLFNRVIVLIYKFLDGKKPPPAPAEDAAWEQFSAHMEALEIAAAIQVFFGVVSSANQRLNETEVWKLAKKDPAAATPIFAELLAKLEVLTRMAKVLMPETAPAMEAMLGDENAVGAAKILFQKVEE